jgi:hypothetical protein
MQWGHGTSLTGLLGSLLEGGLEFQRGAFYKQNEVSRVCIVIM